MIMKRPAGVGAPCHASLASIRLPSSQAGLTGLSAALLLWRWLEHGHFEQAVVRWQAATLEAPESTKCSSCSQSYEPNLQAATVDAHDRLIVTLPHVHEPAQMKLVCTTDGNSNCTRFFLGRCCR